MKTCECCGKTFDETEPGATEHHVFKDDVTDKCPNCGKMRNKVQAIRVPPKVRQEVEAVIEVAYWLYCSKCNVYSAMEAWEEF